MSHLLVAGVQVDAVDREGLQVVDLYELRCALTLGERVLPDGGDAVRGVIARAERAVPSAASLRKKGIVSRAEDVSTATIRRPGAQRGERESDRAGAI